MMWEELLYSSSDAGRMPLRTELVLRGELETGDIAESPSEAQGRKWEGNSFRD